MKFVIFHRSFVILLAFLGADASAQDDGPLDVRAQATRGVHYVGEAIDVRVGVVAEGERPEVIPPRLDRADLTPVGTSFRPISASGIGPFVAERNQFLSRFRLVPHRAGVLEVPPFRARLGDRSGASGPIRLEIEAPPIAGRPATFLGGVGPFGLSAEARPTALRAGQEMEYRIRLDGLGALGATQAPRLDRVPGGLRVEPLPAEFVAEPPARVFRYRLRPTRPGDATLPPVAVSAFDPKSRRYLTRATPGVPIRVVAVPKFDPGTLRYGPDSRPAPSIERENVYVIAGSVLVAALAAVGWLARGRAGRRSDPGRLARRLAGSLGPGPRPDEAASAIQDGLIDYLAMAVGRPRGALTPDEARRGFLRAVGPGGLADRAGALVARCDRARFDRPAREDADALVVAARGFFEELGRVGRRKGEKPGEAVEAAP